MNKCYISRIFDCREQSKFITLDDFPKEPLRLAGAEPAKKQALLDISNIEPKNYINYASLIKKMTHL